ncbi:hypothetical protein CPB84DRAFT_1358042 [Gymnopilus junonius]|uniref:Uncharacterized protein n=1 Tax=Gymnopilus junonius TaxID=109634 RepID=A0A9P5NV02_GYMJU|nr:hypothetical protein CPB84DRAFT_1358042 [Gymnopilus junonius]
MSSTVSTSASTTPRAGSPTKLTPRLKNGVLSPHHGASHTLKSPPPTASVPVTPEMRKTYSLRADDARSRSGSTTSSLHHAASLSSFRPSSPSVLSVSSAAASGSAIGSPRLMSSKSGTALADRGQTSSPTLKIRSKVSNLAKAAAESAPPPPGSTSPPVGPPTRQPNVRTRAPSTVGQQQHQLQQYTASPKLSPASPPQQFYPITTAVPAANPHRFAANRPPASTLSVRTGSPPAGAHHVFQSFSQPSSAAILPDQSPLSSRPRSAAGLMLLNGSATATSRIDPASIPLPPHSPPASAVSFSSRSSVSASASTSVSRSSAASASHSGASSSTDGGYSPRQKRQNDPPHSLRATLDNLMEYTSVLDDDADTGHDRDVSGENDEMDEEREVKAAAKSNRKIADLEITNRSLLAINATLEATKHRQAKEIAELRRKLRESRLILPPRAYRAVKSSLDPSEINDDEEDVSDDNEEDGEGTEAGEGDETYKRVKVILESLLKTGQAALETQAKDFREKSGRGAAKVLSPEEVKDWHGTKGLEIVLPPDNDNDQSFSLESEADQDAYDDEEGEQEHRETMDHGRNFDIPYTYNADNDNREGQEDDGPAFSPPSSPPPHLSWLRSLHSKVVQY